VIEKISLIVLLVLTLVPVAGCGNGSNLVPISGTVSVDGKPVSNGKIVFHPVNGERSGSGPIRKDGSYVVSYLEMGDGLPPGQYKVSIVSDKNNGEPSAPVLVVPSDPLDPANDGFLPVESEESLRYDSTNIHVVPREYNRVETTPLIQVIGDEDGEKSFDFDIPSDGQ